MTRIPPPRNPMKTQYSSYTSAENVKKVAEELRLWRDSLNKYPEYFPDSRFPNLGAEVQSTVGGRYGVSISRELVQAALGLTRPPAFHKIGQDRVDHLRRSLEQPQKQSYPAFPELGDVIKSIAAEKKAVENAKAIFEENVMERLSPFRIATPPPPPPPSPSVKQKSPEKKPPTPKVNKTRGKARRARIHRQLAENAQFEEWLKKIGQQASFRQSLPVRPVPIPTIVVDSPKPTETLPGSPTGHEQNSPSSSSAESAGLPFARFKNNNRSTRQERHRVGSSSDEEPMDENASSSNISADEGSEAYTSSREGSPHPTTIRRSTRRGVVPSTSAVRVQTRASRRQPSSPQPTASVQTSANDVYSERGWTYNLEEPASDTDLNEDFRLRRTLSTNRHTLINKKARENTRSETGIYPHDGDSLKAALDNPTPFNVHSLKKDVKKIGGTFDKLLSKVQGGYSVHKPTPKTKRKPGKTS